MIYTANQPDLTGVYRDGVAIAFTRGDDIDAPKEAHRIAEALQLAEQARPAESEHAIDNAKAWLSEMQRMVRQLGEAEESGDDTKIDAARDEIQQSPLSVMVRDGWYLPGHDRRADKPEEYEILLTTGGPALRIFGALENGEPGDYPRLQWQDWGTPWTDYPARDALSELRSYVAQFCFDV